jgi:hypothetical protein
VEAGHRDDADSALRPLRAVATTVDALRGGNLPEEETRTAVVQIAAAVEMSLRRLLRDLPSAALQVRLRALAPDELRADEVLAELRQHDQISIELAAAGTGCASIPRSLPTTRRSPTTWRIAWSTRPAGRVR